MAAITTEEAKRRKVYIRKNYTNKTLKQMANELGVKVMKLKKYKK